jgi:hypothetical protein
MLVQDYVATSTDAWSSSHNAGAHVLNVNAAAAGTAVFLDMVFTGADSHTGDYISQEVSHSVSCWSISSVCLCNMYARSFWELFGLFV